METNANLGTPFNPMVPPGREPRQPKGSRLLLALSAVASLYVCRATGIDGGLIDEVISATVEALREEPMPQPAPPVPPPVIEPEQSDADLLKLLESK